MSLAILHFCFGFSAGLLIALAARPDPRIVTALLFLSGVWAMGPDICQVTPIECEATHGQWWTNAFWLHQYWDQIDPDDAPQAASGMVWVTCINLAAYTLLGYRERFNPALEHLLDRVGLRAR